MLPYQSSLLGWKKIWDVFLCVWNGITFFIDAFVYISKSLMLKGYFKSREILMWRCKYDAVGFKPAITNVFMALVVHRCSSSSSCWQTLSTLLCRPTYCPPALPKRERSDLSPEPSSPLKSKIRRTERHITGLWRNSGTVSSNNKKLMPWYRSI